MKEFNLTHHQDKQYYNKSISIVSFCERKARLDNGNYNTNLPLPVFPLLEPVV